MESRARDLWRTGRPHLSAIVYVYGLISWSERTRDAQPIMHIALFVETLAKPRRVESTGSGESRSG